jgi:hypothetical protein
VVTGSDLSGYQLALARLYQARLKSRESAALFDFSFAHDKPQLAATVKIARLPLILADGSPLWAVGSLGTVRIAPSEPAGLHEHQFVGIYDSDSLELCEFVAACYHFDLRVEPLDDGHTVPLGKASGLRTAGFSAGLLLRGDYYAPFAEPIPRLEGVSTSLFSVVLVTTEEVEFKKQRGLTSLLKKWRRERRDVFRVGAPTPH